MSNAELAARLNLKTAADPRASGGVLVRRNDINTVYGQRMTANTALSERC
jgi:hypothetical protein